MSSDKAVLSLEEAAETCGLAKSGLCPGSLLSKLEKRNQQLYDQNVLLNNEAGHCVNVDDLRKADVRDRGSSAAVQRIRANKDIESDHFTDEIGKAWIARALEAEKNYKFMVERAADQKLDGYRELGAKVAQTEQERDALKHVLSATEHACKTLGDALYSLRECEGWDRAALIAERDEARASLRNLRAVLGGCGNKPCILHVGPYKGQHTNGPCHCKQAIADALKAL